MLHPAKFFWTEYSDRETFLVAYPQSTSFRAEGALLDEPEECLCVDRDRIYVTGFCENQR